MKRINFFIQEKKLEFLQALDGTVSEHLRHAIDDYIEKKREFNVSASSSRGGVKND